MDLDGITMIGTKSVLLAGKSLKHVLLLLQSCGQLPQIVATQHAKPYPQKLSAALECLFVTDNVR